MLTGENGILTQANEASNKTKEASAKEKVEVEVMGSYGNNGEIDKELLKNNLNNIPGIEGVPSTITSLPITVTVDGYGIEIDENGNVEIVEQRTFAEIKGEYFPEDTTVTIEGNKVFIPAGATVSGVESESSSLGINSANKDNEGLVIYITNEEKDITDWEAAKTQYDQFVWVPVETAYVTVDEIGGDSIDNLKTYITNNNKYPMAIKVNETDYKGILYNFEGTTSLTITPYDYNATSSTNPSYREPDEISDDSSNGVALETLKSEFNTMVEKVAINGGFWVGRYETSNMNSSSFTTKEGAVNVVKGKQNGINSVKWYKMYEGQKEYKAANLGNKSTTTSSMIWGSQWDQIMIWMKDVRNTNNNSYYITNSLTMGNFGTSDDSTSGLADTGFYSVKNIYDLAGNVYDWTLEAGSTGGRVLRRRQLR